MNLRRPAPKAGALAKLSYTPGIMGCPRLADGNHVLLETHGSKEKGVRLERRRRGRKKEKGGRLEPGSLERERKRNRKGRPKSMPG